MSPRTQVRVRDLQGADLGTLELSSRSDGIGLHGSDSRDALLRFFARNPGLSEVVKMAAGEIVGAVLCGHDGRRGALHHLAVTRSLRCQGTTRTTLQKRL